jgi:hypothetical protein
LAATQLEMFYSDRITAFETDRLSFHNKLEDCRLKEDIVHKSDWELQKRSSERHQLENALNHCQTLLHMEQENTRRML